MREQLIEKIMEEVIKKVDTPKADEARKKEEKKYSSLTEFVGTGIGDSIGLVIANVDNSIHEAMNLDKKYRSIGILGARTGAGPQIMAADEAVKATNTEILAVELARDTKGGAGHGSLIIFGAEDVADARRAVEVALKELDRTFGDVYANEAGHIELQYTARASYACETAFNAPVGKSFGLVVGAPAAIGIVLADTVVKAANVDVISYSSPAKGTSFTNEVILTFSGDSGAVRQALITAREAGVELLGTLGDTAVSTTVPYI
ncbi:propanediol utilization microcompartment protein PduB [Bacillus sp. PK3_68]|uniref:propanediol utilization microcompartment protein PduB n=1 Tax=Bacillus sp. PK3_68 TaxID=2027408 RepID=UPI000E71F5ED|nr:propanediol utilization microcompartment protein PduB [Bacillus sp. PK3_68]RJS62346.1 microcompartment protein PduB [Bacillus sp. PK3_68]